MGNEIVSSDFSHAYDNWKSQYYINKKFQDYYLGKHPMIFTAERLYDVFGRSTVSFVENWCAVVVDAVTDRLGFKGWDGNNLDTSKELFGLYTKNKLKTLSRRVHRDCVVTGSGYIMFDKVNGESTPYYQDPNNMVIIYSAEDYYKMSYALKIWRSTSGVKANLYYEDRIEKYISESDKALDAQNFTLDEVTPNPYDKIPIVHFRSDVTELANIIPLQDAINKTFSDMMVVSEFNAFPQRWIITNADIASLKASPQTIFKIPKGLTDEEETKIGQFAAARIGSYLEVIDRLSGAIAVISRTPKHYFMQTGANVSGEALSIMEIPLVKKTEQYQEIMDEGWMEVLKFLYGTTENIITVWHKIEVEMMEVTADTIKTEVEAGIPLVTILRRLGWSDDEIAQMVSDKLEESKSQPINDTNNVDLEDSSGTNATIDI